MEKAFDGNICRCTGYRPILDACKSLCQTADIEDLVCSGKTSTEPYSKCKPADRAFPSFLQNRPRTSAHFQKNGLSWVRPSSLDNVFELLEHPGSYFLVLFTLRLKGIAGSRLVVANTALGIYKEDPSKLLIDVQDIPELNESSVSHNSIKAGGNVTVTALIKLLQVAKASNDRENNKAYLSALITHLERIANKHVRNVGSIAGNLALAKSRGFLSDLATVMLGARSFVVLQSATNIRQVTVDEFLSYPEWRGELIRSIEIPLLGFNQTFNSYKTAVRPVKAHALINAAFLLTREGDIIKDVTLAFGGVLQCDVPGSRPILASRTEQFLKGKSLCEQTLHEALQVLKSEIIIEDEEKKATRQQLVSSFFYKFFVSQINVHPSFQSAALDLFKTRPTSKGSQKFTVTGEHLPVSEPIGRSGGLNLASGDAEFIDDMPTGNCVFGAFFTSDVANAEVISIDVSEALAAPGVIDWVTGADAPGQNNASVTGENHPVFADKKICYHGQPMGLIIADTQRHAEAAAKLVKVTYKKERPILSTADAKAAGLDFRGEAKSTYSGESTEASVLAAVEQSDYRLSGKIILDSQLHFYMEPHVANARIDENGSLILHSANQFPKGVSQGVSAVMGLPHNKIKLVCRRMGGAFGGKIIHSITVAAAVSIAAHKVGREVRLAVGRNQDMRFAGGREEIDMSYDVGFDARGKITALKVRADLNSGLVQDISMFCNNAFVIAFSQAYDLPKFFLESQLFQTNSSSRTAVRGPSELEASWCMETILEHIAHSLGKPVEEIRELNFLNETEAKAGKILPSTVPMDHFTVPRIFSELSKKTNEPLLRQAVAEYNANNRWKKRGISKAPVRYQVSLYPRPSLVNCYEDGSIVIHHSTADMGQGAHIKVQQAVSNKLGELFNPPKPVDINIMRCVDLDSHALPNVTFTGGSTSSEGSCESAHNAASEIVSRFALVKRVLEEENADKKQKGEELIPINWLSICARAAGDGINMSSFGFVEGGKTYQNYGGCVSVVELDVITGEVEILMSHMIYDCGKSLNPAIDIGQAEGAFVMGLGRLFREEVRYTAEGKLINDGTWEYKPPSFRDIPQVFNVELLSNAPYEKGFLSSKASGEPPLVLANSAGLALRDAIRAAREENDLQDFFILNIPMTPDRILEACGRPTLSFRSRL